MLRSWLLVYMFIKDVQKLKANNDITMEKLESLQVADDHTLLSEGKTVQHIIDKYMQ